MPALKLEFESCRIQQLHKLRTRQWLTGYLANPRSHLRFCHLNSPSDSRRLVYLIFFQGFMRYLTRFSHVSSRAFAKSQLCQPHRVQWFPCGCLTHRPHHEPCPQCAVLSHVPALPDRNRTPRETPTCASSNLTDATGRSGPAVGVRRTFCSPYPPPLSLRHSSAWPQIDGWIDL